MKPLWDVIGKRWLGYVFSVLLIIPGVVALVTNSMADRGALNWGVDFTGGNYFHFKLERVASIGQIREMVDRFATGQSIIQAAEQDVFIRTRPLTAQEKAGFMSALRQEFGGVTVLREDEVGPTIGRELRNTAIIGLIIGLLLQLIYVSVRFKSVRYAVTMDLALLHDLLIVVGVFAITRTEVNSSFVAVLLTVVGYSINDKIVLFDRIRENLAMRTREVFERLVNRSLLESLVRSINTSVTVILAIAAVYFFGGVTVRDLAFGLTVGVAISAYSSVFNAGALLVDWDLWSDRRSGRNRTAEVSVLPTGPAMPSPVGPSEARSSGTSRSPAGSGRRRRRSRRR